MKYLKRVRLHSVVVAASLVLGFGCVAPNARTSGSSTQHGSAPAKEQEFDHFSTIDIADCIVSEHVKQHGPYRIEMQPPIHFFGLSTPVFFIRQIPEFDPSNSHFLALAELADTFKEKAKREISGTDREPELSDMILISRDFMAFGYNNGNSNFEMSKLKNSNPKLEGCFSMLGFSLYSGSYVASSFDARPFVPSCAERHRDIFPAHGRGKLLKIQAVHAMCWQHTDPVKPFFHTEWTLFLMGDRRPLPKIQYMGIPANYDGTLFSRFEDHVYRDPATEKLLLKTASGEVPLYEVQFRETAGIDRFDAALVQLLNSMSDTDLDELEDVSW